MTTPDLPLGTTVTNTIRFCQEVGPYDEVMAKPPEERFRIIDVSVTKRDWLVTDPEARAAEARKVLPDPDDERWRTDAQWYIDAEKNAAALLIYRLEAQFPEAESNGDE